jgi:hypothetical protein|mmetsp:Transcript_35096/g.96986  ORF Transcript_35096/g.96986 Transcript_35096/m.96986 type:complete len:109 (-) Transcript_35096:141-467(-)
MSVWNKGSAVARGGARVGAKHAASQRSLPYVIHLERHAIQRSSTEYLSSYIVPLLYVLLPASPCALATTREGVGLRSHAMADYDELAVKEAQQALPAARLSAVVHRAA